MTAYANAISDKEPAMSRRDLSRLETLRASQLPFCGLEYVTGVAQGGIYEGSTFYSSYFTSVGTTVHSVLQRFMARSGKVLGKYECHICGKTRLSTDPMCCDFQSEYHELEIRYKNIIVGHIDGIFKASDGTYWIIDYKTCTLVNGPDKAKNPGSQYREQLLAYACIATIQYKLNIAGVADIFVPRDNPTKPHIWCHPVSSEDRARVLAGLKKDAAIHALAREAKTLTDLRQLWNMRICHSESEAADKKPFCGYASHCARNKPEYFILAFKRGLAQKNLPVSELLKRYQKPKKDRTE